MKKIFIAVIIILLCVVAVWSAYRARLRSLPIDTPPCVGNEIWDNTQGRCVQPPNPNVTEDTFDITKINHVTLAVDDGEKKKTVEIVRRETEKKFTAQFKTEDSMVEGSIVLLDEKTVSHSTTGDVFIPYAVNYGGSGSFIYVGLFKRENDTTLSMQDTLLIGDRILIDTLALEGSVSPYTIYIRFHDRMKGEAFTAPPTVAKELSMAISEGRFGKGGVSIDNPVVVYKDLLKVATPMPGDEITSPLVVRGQARGTWFFEASFPIVVVDWDGKIIGEGHAEAQSDWMTESYVPFAGTISFTVPAGTTNRRGTVIFKKDNPSGLPQNDDAFEIPVVFE